MSGRRSLSSIVSRKYRTDATVTPGHHGPGCVGSSTFEDLVHHLCTGADDRPQLAPVDSLRRSRGAVPDQSCYLLDRDTLLAHDRDECVPQLPGAPVRADPGSPHRPCGRHAVHGRGRAGFRPPMRTPSPDRATGTRQQPILRLLHLVGLQRVNDCHGETERAPGLLGLHVAVRAHRPPYGHVRRDRRIGIWVTVQIHVIPAQRARFLGPAAGQQA